MVATPKLARRGWVTIFFFALAGLSIWQRVRSSSKRNASVSGANNIRNTKDLFTVIERVLEPEVMESVEEARDYNNMDHSAVNIGFVDDLIAAGFQGGDVLDLGTGTALIPIELAKRGLECRIMAADAAISMLDLARLNVEIASLMDVIQLSQCDAKDMAYSSEMFPWVISNSIVHHIPDPMAVLREAWRVTKRGGWLFFRDLARPGSVLEVDRLVELYTVGCNDHQRQLFRDSLFAALTAQEMGQMVSEFGVKPETVTMTSDRHWTWIGQKPE